VIDREVARDGRQLSQKKKEMEEDETVQLTKVGGSQDHHWLVEGKLI
jgi:hypothetical protein